MENTMGKGEIAHYEQFLLFPQCFQKDCFPGVSKGVIVWEWVKMLSAICLNLDQSKILLSGNGLNYNHHHYHCIFIEPGKGKRHCCPKGKMFDDKQKVCVETAGSCTTASCPTGYTQGWLVVLGFYATLTAYVISWWSVTHTCFLAFSHQY